MNLYFYYSIMICMIMNTIIYVPSVLVNHKDDGVILGVILSTLIGTTLTFIFAKTQHTFAGQGLPEIFQGRIHNMLRRPILVFLGGMWFMAGAIILVSFSILLSRSISPEISPEAVLVLIMITISFCAAVPTTTILYLLEIMLLINVPLVAMIFLKAVSNDYVSWYAIWDVFSDHALKLPNLDVVSAATYVYSGYLNMAIFNREFKKPFRTRFLWLIPIMGIVVLLNTFLIPIGFHGTVAVTYFVNVWASTADSMQTQFGFVERVIYIFLLLYLSLSLMFSTISWHVGYHLIHWKSNRRIGAFRLDLIIIFAVFGVTAFSLLHFTNEKFMLSFTTYWLHIRLWSEIGLVSLLFYLARKEKTTQ